MVPWEPDQIELGVHARLDLHLLAVEHEFTRQPARPEIQGLLGRRQICELRGFARGRDELQREPAQSKAVRISRSQAMSGRALSEPSRSQGKYCVFVRTSTGMRLCSSA